MHDWEIPVTLEAIGQADTGVDNISVDTMKAPNIPVFNAPGADTYKNLYLQTCYSMHETYCPACDFARNLDGGDAEVKAGKKHFVGFELPGKTIGVIGLCTIDIKIANIAIVLGMGVIGYDLKITVYSTWQLSHAVEQASKVDDLLTHCDFVTLHAPLIESTKNMINAHRIANMSDNITILNFSNRGIVDDES